MRSTLVLLALGALVAAKDYPTTSCGKSASHNLIVGNRTYGDRLLYSGDEHIDSAFLRVRTRDFTWPLHPNASHPETITMIEAVDKFRDGKGGCAYLKSGGPGTREASLHLKTQRGGEADFHISIYGK